MRPYLLQYAYIVSRHPILSKTAITQRIASFFFLVLSFPFPLTHPLSYSFFLLTPLFFFFPLSSLFSLLSSFSLLFFFFFLFSFFSLLSSFLQLRRYFPSQASVMPTLPEKDFFNYLDSHVVDKRRRALEEYMTRIVQRLPTVSCFLSLAFSLSLFISLFLSFFLRLFTFPCLRLFNYLSIVSIIHPPIKFFIYLFFDQLCFYCLFVLPFISLKLLNMIKMMYQTEVSKILCG